jgi:hypothetical protein
MEPLQLLILEAEAVAVDILRVLQIVVVMEVLELLLLD